MYMVHLNHGALVSQVIKGRVFGLEDATEVIGKLDTIERIKVEGAPS